MKDLIEQLDSLLILVGKYPVTMWNTFALPRKAFVRNPSFPPSISFLVSIILFYNACSVGRSTESVHIFWKSPPIVFVMLHHAETVIIEGTSFRMKDQIQA